MSQFAREDFQGDVGFVSNGNITLESDRDQDGVGDLVFRTAGVERARIKHDGSGTGWSNVLGGSMPAVTLTPTSDQVVLTGKTHTGQTADLVQWIDVDNTSHNSGLVFQFQRGRLNLYDPRGWADTTKAPEIHLLGASTLTDGGQAGWGLGIDVGNPTNPQRDFAIFKLNYPSSGSVADMFYITNRDNKDPVFTIGGSGGTNTGAYMLRILTQSVTAEPAMGNLNLIQGSGQTGSPLTLTDAGSTHDRVWFDISTQAGTWNMFLAGDTTTANPILSVVDKSANTTISLQILANGRIIWANDANAAISRTAAGVLTVTNQLVTSGRFTMNGDFLVIKDGSNISVGGTTGTSFGNNTAQKISFYGKTPIVQPSAVGTATGYAAGTTAATFHSDDTYTGNVGTTAYTINGLIAALKNLGLIAS